MNVSFDVCLDCHHLFASIAQRSPRDLAVEVPANGVAPDHRVNPVSMDRGSLDC